MPLLKKLTLLSLLSATAVFAQQRYTANKIVFKHPGGFTQAQLEAVSGMHHGTAFTVDDLTVAAQKLSDTSYFDNVGCSVEGSGATLTVVFDLTPSDPSQFLPVGFENIVWLTRDEILSAIREKLPLYNGTIPETGPQASTINATLTTALSMKGVTAKVSHKTIEPSVEHPARVIDFVVVSPRIIVATVKIGVPATIASLLQASAKAVTGKPYNDGLGAQLSDGLGGLLSAEALLAPIRNAGYVRSSLGGITFDDPTISAGSVPLVLNGTITPGDIYHLSSLSYAGTPLYSADDFAKTATLHTGDLAAENKLRESLAPIDKAYRSKGYADVIVFAKPTFDENAKTVAYEITVTPGEVYLIQTVTATGLDPKAQADFDKYFLQHEGQPFNPAYINDFFKNNTAIASLRDYGAGWKAVSHPTTHTVELSLSFLKSGSTLQQKVVVH